MESDTTPPDVSPQFLAVVPRETVLPPDAVHVVDFGLKVQEETFSVVLSKLKRAALMFDRIEVVGLARVFEYLNSDQINELEFLLDRRVLDDCYAHLSDFYRERFEERYSSAFFESSSDWFDTPEQDRHKREYEVGATNCRRAAAYLVREKGWEAVALMDARFNRSQKPEQGAEVAQLVLKTLPLPNESTPWDDILEYRDDSDARGQFYRLKTWMNDVSARLAETSPRHFEDELRSRIYDYEHYMSLHRIKARSGILETMVVTAAEILGDLLKIRWGDAARAMFDIRRQRIALLEEELDAPNREIAYIVKARETFTDGSTG